MPETLTIHLARPITAVGAPKTTSASRAIPGGSEDAESQAIREHLAAALEAAQHQKLQEIEAQKAELTQSCETVGAIVARLDKLYQDTLTQNRTEIARLAVEIARKVLMHKTNQRDYDIQAIVEEALKRTPTRQEITIRLNPEDLPQCQQLQQTHPDSPLGEVSFVADWSIARADCLVETPKGVVKSFVEEHLERIGEALAKVK
ncbi:MAG: hypothetical protein JW741_30795 [Sedimentisphaerales bacterium]|nr:hypothetical protein [Sedimentisphaerales bacterium]